MEAKLLPAQATLPGGVVHHTLAQPPASLLAPAHTGAACRRASTRCGRMGASCRPAKALCRQGVYGARHKPAQCVLGTIMRVLARSLTLREVVQGTMFAAAALMVAAAILPALLCMWACPESN